jgi:hypothetical protein
MNDSNIRTPTPTGTPFETATKTFASFSCVSLPGFFGVSVPCRMYLRHLWRGKNERGCSTPSGIRRLPR